MQANTDRTNLQVTDIQHHRASFCAEEKDRRVGVAATTDHDFMRVRVRSVSLANQLQEENETNDF